MSKSKKFLAFQTKQEYILGVLSSSSAGWQIVYYAMNPATKRLERVRIKLNRLLKVYPTDRQKRSEGLKILSNINRQLSSGWSPFFASKDTRLFERLDIVVGRFISEKSKELRPDTIRSYNSFCSQFTKWADINYSGIYASMVTHSIAVRFMDYVYSRDVKPRSYNNLVKMGRCFYNWTIEKGYSEQNPFLKIKTKRVFQKERTIIPPNIRKKIATYLNSTSNYHQLLILNLVYSSLLRPKEIRFLKVRDIDLINRAITVPSDVAKNHHRRTVALSQTSINLLYRIKKFDFPQDYYLIGYDFAPSNIQCTPKKFASLWVDIRQALHLPKNMQLYSLKDTGIFEMLKAGIDNLSVMQHADHADLAMTTKYANHFDKNLIEKIYNNAPDF